jgi:hypothetical protein
MSINDFHVTTSYVAGVFLKTIIDNPFTTYRQYIQQFATNTDGRLLSTEVSRNEARSLFLKYPITSCTSGITPRIIGICGKAVPKFVTFVGVNRIMDGPGHKPSVIHAAVSSLLTAPIINALRMIEKQQRSEIRTTGKVKSIRNILKESSNTYFRPLLRGFTPLLGHSFISTSLALVGQPKMQSKLETTLKNTGIEKRFICNLLASTIISPIYVTLTNPLARMEVIMQTKSAALTPISLRDTIRLIFDDSRTFGIRGLFRGNGIGILKAIIALTSFHEGRMIYLQMVGLQDVEKISQ